MSIVTDRIAGLVNEKIVRLAAFAERTALAALQDMQDFQRGSGQAWNNETNQAFLGLFSGPINERDAVGFFVAHTMFYGVFLELANDRQNAILVPTAERWAKDLLDYAKELFGASA